MSDEVRELCELFKTKDKEEGMMEYKIKLAREMLKNKENQELIQKYTGLSFSRFSEIKDSLKA